VLLAQARADWRQSAMKQKLAAIIERAHAEARKLADLAIAEIDGLVRPGRRFSAAGR